VLDCKIIHILLNILGSVSNLVKELPEDGTLVPKHVAVVKTIVLCMLCEHLVGLVDEVDLPVLIFVLCM